MSLISEIDIPDSSTFFIQFLNNDEQAVKDTSSLYQDTISKNELTTKNSVFTGHLLQKQNTKPISRTNTGEPLLLISILLSVFLVTITRFSYRKKMGAFVRSAFSVQLFNQISREANFKTDTLTVLLYINYVLNLSLILYLGFQVFTGQRVLFGLLHAFLEIILLLSIYLLGQILLFKFIGHVFKTRDETSDYINNNLVFTSLTGLSILPLIIFFYYSHLKIAFYIAIILIVFQLIIRWFRSLTFTPKRNKFSVLYLFFYLCTLEILPLFVIAKAIIGR